MRVFVIFCFCTFSLFSYSQDKSVPLDTILFNSGRVLATRVIDTLGRITIEKPNSHKHKQVEIERSEIFSIRYGSTGKEVILYFYDTLIGNDFTVADARLFIAGEQDARKGFHATGTTIGAFVVGFGSGITGASFYAFGPPFLYMGLMAYPRIHIPHKSVTNLNDVKSDAYLYGYDSVGRKKRVMKSLVWGGIGLLTGYVVHFVFFNQLQNL